jgi:hypothetical protein
MKLGSLFSLRVRDRSLDNLIDAYYLRRDKPTVGRWEPDPVKFPRSMKSFAEDIEGKAWSRAYGSHLVLRMSRPASLVTPRFSFSSGSSAPPSR